MTVLGIVLTSVLGVGVVFAIYYTFFLMPSLRKKDINQKLDAIMQEKGIEYTLARIRRAWCDFRLDTEDTTYYFKMFVIPGRQELSVSSKYKWQVIGGSKGFLFLDGIQPFLDGPCKTEKKIIKVAVLYPFCKLVTYYKNEIDKDFATPKVDVYGAKIITFDELDDKFDWL